MMRADSRLVAGLLACALTGALAGCASQPARPLTLDTHVDIPLAYMHEARYDVGSETALKVDLPKMERGGLDAAFFVLFVEQGALTADGYAKAVAEAQRKLSGIEAMLARYPQRIRLATTPEQLRRHHAEGVLSALIGIENAYSLGHDLARLDDYYRRGVRYLGLVHVGDNDLCTSSAPDTERGERADSGVGLSAFGRDAVRRANALGMMVDVSHASDDCVRDVLAASSAPVIASHSSARALVDHARNLPDDLLRAIAAKGGVIQAVAYKEFLKVDPARKAAEKALEQAVARAAGDTAFDSETHERRSDWIEGMRRIDARYPLATLDDFLDHVAHIAKIAGVDHVGIASDFDGGGEVTGWRDASETRNVTDGLRRRGFSEAEIAGIWSGNFLRTWQAVETAAGQP